MRRSVGRSGARRRRRGFGLDAGADVTLAVAAFLVLMPLRRAARHPQTAGLGAFAGLRQPAEPERQVAAVRRGVPGDPAAGAGRWFRGWPTHRGRPERGRALGSSRQRWPASLAAALIVVRLSGGLPWGDGLGRSGRRCRCGGRLLPAALARRLRGGTPGRRSCVRSVDRRRLGRPRRCSCSGCCCASPAAGRCTSSRWRSDRQSILAVRCWRRPDCGSPSLGRPAGRRSSTSCGSRSLALAVANVVVFHATGRAAQHLLAARRDPEPAGLPARIGQPAARRRRAARQRARLAVRRRPDLFPGRMVSPRPDRLRHARPARLDADRAVLRRRLRAAAACRRRPADGRAARRSSAWWG